MKQQDAINKECSENYCMEIITMITKINVLILRLEETPKVISRKQNRVQQNKQDERSKTAKNPSLRNARKRKWQERSKLYTNKTCEST